MSQIQRIKRPEGGAEHGVVWQRRHGCPQGKALSAALEDNSVDLLIFPVGQVGWQMPLNTPFVVRCVEPCGACGADVQAWCEWTGPRIWTPA